MKLTFLNHASFVFSHKDKKILFDPYLNGSAFNNGWHLICEEDHELYLKNITHIFFSHEHPDHFQPNFFKRFSDEEKAKITIIYQKTYDKKVLNFCKKIGFNTLEVTNNSIFKIDEEISFQCVKNPIYDSWCALYCEDEIILNVNDCVLDDPSLINKISKILKRNPTVLFSQFSYSSFAYSASERKALAKKKTDILLKQINKINPKFVIPFASFVYFSQEDNFYMNDSINDVEKVHSLILNNTNSKSIIMKPNQEWDLNSEIDSNEAILFWMKKFREIKIKEIELKKYNYDELKTSATKYQKSIFKNNNKLLINILLFLKIIPHALFYVTDHKKYYQFSLGNSLIKIEKPLNGGYVSLKSDSLKFLFDYMFGLDTLLVNSRFTPSDKLAVNRLTRCFIFGGLNNTGRYLNKKLVISFFDYNFLKRSIKIFLKNFFK
ncbi:MBL fold metallo-hydrolase [Candidatus Pelagibacter sp.]|nr:MBL fold metallo-hydrolase [Candidatus Pelagibacter sp.]